MESEVWSFAIAFVIAENSSVSTFRYPDAGTSGHVDQTERTQVVHPRGTWLPFLKLKSINQASAANGALPSGAPLLGDVFAFGVIMAPARKGPLLCSDEAARILQGPSPTRGSGALKSLPEPLKKIVREVRATGKRVTNRKVRLTQKSREPQTIRVHAAPIREGKGGTAVVLLLSDIAPLKSLEQNISHLHRLAAIGAFSAGMAHEIKNALVAGKTFIELLLEQNRSHELTQTVSRELSRIDLMVSQMLRLAAPAREALSKVQIHQLLDQSLRLLESQFKQKRIQLNRLFHAQVDSIQGNDHQLQQAFMNLLLNALEAMGAGGALEVKTEITLNRKRNAEQKLRIHIQDNGVGIAAANLQHLFEPFFTTKPSGTGLGLAITRQIITEHQGSLEIHTAPGAGTTVSILLPVQSP